MKSFRSILLLHALSGLASGLAYGQAQHTNTNGVNIDTDGEANSFLTALARGTSISFSELGYLDGVSSALQTQLDSKVSLTGTQTIAGDKTLSGNTAMSGNLTVDTNTLFVDSVNNRVGIKTATPSLTAHINGAVYLNGNTSNNTSMTDFTSIEANYLVEGAGAYWGLRQDTSNNVHLQVYNSGAPVTAFTFLQNGKVGILNTAPTEALDVTGNIKASGKISSTKIDSTLAAAATTLAITNNFVKVTGDAGGNTLATITGGSSGQTLTLLFVDALVTITDTDAATADTVDLSAAFTSTARDTITLIYDGTKWIETSRSVN